MKTDFGIALTQLAAERNLSKEVILRTVEAALVSIFKRNSFAPNQEISVKIAPQTGEVRVYAQKVVVEKPSDLRQELSLSAARKLKPDIHIGEMIQVESTPENAGRIAAQTAKQVILQRLRDAERDAVFGEYADKEGEVVSGVVHYIEPRHIIIDLGRAEAILPQAEQVSTEHYRVGQRFKSYLVKVQRTSKGTQLIVSRTHQGLLRRLFEMEIPEIYRGVVEIKALAREPGYRSKVAVAARQEGVDAIGCCVGLRSIRIQNISRELNGEKIDIVEWHYDPAVFIANALSPASVVRAEINEGEKSTTVVVPSKQLSLAIGKGGQNARLAARLTGWRIDIKSLSTVEEERATQVEEAAPAGALPPTGVISEPLAEEKVSTPEEVVEAAPAGALPPTEAIPKPLAEEKISTPEEVVEAAPARALPPTGAISELLAEKKVSTPEEVVEAAPEAISIQPEVEAPAVAEVTPPSRSYSIEEILSEIEAATESLQIKFAGDINPDTKIKVGKQRILPKGEIPEAKTKPKKAPRRQPILEDEEYE